MSKHRIAPEDQRTILGITLTKRGWNNVLIYTVLGFMFVFYFLGHESGEIAQQSSLSPFSERTIVQIEDAEVQWMRVGAQWQQMGGDPMDAEVFRRWLNAWQNLELRASQTLLSGREYSVTIVLADHPEPLRVGVFYQNGQVLVALPGADVTYEVIAPEPEQLQPAQ
ncbi:MAG: hypothetical protein HLUCCO02_11335 [Idiomarinaceae bacterium HL-53]|nr:MAG: hypothetical protein HLUCCO02_11335 [Idiomarinaceae bacterium HL-53]CUS47606.1 hypothetical protein Ga0003345_0539 [Idiomarinaceae bacterium HL-53]